MCTVCVQYTQVCAVHTMSVHTNICNTHMYTNICNTHMNVILTRAITVNSAKSIRPVVILYTICTVCVQYTHINDLAGLASVQASVYIMPSSDIWILFAYKKKALTYITSD